MNTNKTATTVLCFGDSNTRGTRPDAADRYDAQVRWTGQLQDELGGDYYVIEEGLGGRTTAYNDTRVGHEYRNGMDYFKPCFQSHYPVNVAVIMLSTNDFKNMFDVSAEQSAINIREYCNFIADKSDRTKIILVAPAAIVPVEPIEFYDESSRDKSIAFPGLLEQVAADVDAAFINAGDVVVLGRDGLHWTVESNKKFAQLLANVIKETAS